MNKKKGFTLIELLAVIVILAVIALIATPIIMNVINDSKKGAAKDAMYGYVKAVELASAQMITPTTEAPTGEYKIENGNLKKGSELLDITFKGSKPNNGGTVVLSKGKVVSATLKFDGIFVTYDGKEVGELMEYVVGEEIYFDPTGAVTECKAGKEWTPSNVRATCYKWNVIQDNGNNIEMLLDHNTTANIAWLTKADYIAAGGTEEEYGVNGNNQYGPVTVLKQLKTDTNSWSKVETLTSSDNVTRTNANGGTYTINYNGMKARFISAQEIADIAKDTTWEPTTNMATSIESVPWLYQNLSSSNLTTPKGYWSDTAHLSDSRTARCVYFNATLNASLVYNNRELGIRPVVRVLKSNI